MTNMKDATLTASKSHNYVNPPFRQTVQVRRFPSSQMDVARAAYYNRPTAPTSEEQYAGVAAAQRRKHREAGTLTPSARAAQARSAAMKATKSRATPPPQSPDRFQSTDARRPRAERPRTDALRPRQPRTGMAGVSSQPAHARPASQAQSPASQAQRSEAFATPQASLGSFATSYQSARSFLSRLSSGMSRTSNRAPASAPTPKVPRRGLLGWLSRWLSWS